MRQYSVERFPEQAELAAFVRECDRQFDISMENTAKKIAEQPDFSLLGLVGPTCAGKTTAAKKLVQTLSEGGRTIYDISLDDFYFDKEYLKILADRNPDVEIDYDSEETIDVALLESCVSGLREHRSVTFPKFNFHSGKREGWREITPGADDLFLFEGIQILYPKVDRILRQGGYISLWIAPESSIRVGGELFLPNEIRLLRRLVRDHRYRDARPEFTFYLWRSVRENEEKSIFPYTGGCDFRMDSTMPYEIGMLKPFLEELLPAVPASDPAFPEAQRILKKIKHVQEVPVGFRTNQSLYKEFI